MPHRTVASRRTKRRDEKFFAVLAAGGMIRDALAASGYKRRTVYDWRKADPEFERRWREADDEALELMEQEADRRAMEGTQKPVFYQGMECGYVTEYSDTLLIFRMKAKDPEKYRDNFKHEHVGAGGGPIQSITRRIVDPAGGDGSAD